MNVTSVNAMNMNVTSVNATNMNVTSVNAMSVNAMSKSAMSVTAMSRIATMTMIAMSRTATSTVEVGMGDMDMSDTGMNDGATDMDVSATTRSCQTTLIQGLLAGRTVYMYMILSPYWVQKPGSFN